MVDEFEANRSAYLRDLVAECETDGLELVRLKYADRNYPDFALEAVRDWIAGLERAIAESRGRAARRAALKESVAAIAAVIAAIAAIAGLFWGRG